MYIIKSLEQTCFGCPSQWEGKTKCGKDIYIRYRWGHLRLDIDDNTEFELEHGDSFDGCIGEYEMLILLKNHISY